MKNYKAFNYTVDESTGKKEIFLKLIDVDLSTNNEQKELTTILLKVGQTIKLKNNGVVIEGFDEDDFYQKSLQGFPDDFENFAYVKIKEDDESIGMHPIEQIKSIAVIQQEKRQTSTRFPQLSSMTKPNKNSSNEVLENRSTDVDLHFDLSVKQTIRELSRIKEYDASVKREIIECSIMTLGNLLTKMKI